MKLFKNIIKGDRLSLAKGITLIESDLDLDVKKSEELIGKCLPYSGNSIRICVTGAPGVGKSTFIESFGNTLILEGKKVAVLAIDPSSETTKGSILGDKIRMSELASNKDAFIRPSPSSGELGGIAKKTRENIILCEAAGFDIILIETVGVGQSETIAKNLVDYYLLLSLTGAGDEIQFIKRGIMELIDGLVVTKADGDNIKNAKKTEQEYRSTINSILKSENFKPFIGICSATKNQGIKEIWEEINDYIEMRRRSDEFLRNRVNQNIFWLNQILKNEIGNLKYQKLVKNNRLVEFERKITTHNFNIYKLINQLH
tara:strand:+ start:369 stop:1313 length:945 start_codon:yes stop_codon:yes gene_type:complete